VLDPLVQVSSRLGEFSKYVVFDAEPRMRHVRYDLWSLSMSLREVI
jgi:hypothetical protein